VVKRFIMTPMTIGGVELDARRLRTSRCGGNCLVYRIRGA